MEDLSININEMTILLDMLQTAVYKINFIINEAIGNEVQQSDCI